MRANLSGKDAAYDEAVAHYNGLLIQAVNTIADDLTLMASLDLQVQAETRATQAAQQAYALAQQRYRAGVGSFLEVLSVREQLLTAQQRMAALVAQQRDAALQLIQALGGGFEADSLPPSLLSSDHG